MVTFGHDTVMPSVSAFQIHLSFSLQTGTNSGDKPVEIQVGLVKVFLQSVGVVLTDIQDVVFKLVLLRSVSPGFLLFSTACVPLFPSLYVPARPSRRQDGCCGTDVIGGGEGFLLWCPVMDVDIIRLLVRISCFSGWC